MDQSSLPQEGFNIVLINFDREEHARVRTWAQLQSLLAPDTHIAALTVGRDLRILDAALAEGITALHPLGFRVARLIEILNNVGSGQVDFAPVLKQRAQEVIIEPLAPSALQIGE